MIEQPVQHIRGVTHTDVDDFGVERGVLIGDVGVEQPAWLRAVLGIDVTRTLAFAANTKTLAVRR